MIAIELICQNVCFYIEVLYEEEALFSNLLIKPFTKFPKLKYLVLASTSCKV